MRRFTDRCLSLTSNSSSSGGSGGGGSRSTACTQPPIHDRSWTCRHAVAFWSCVHATCMATVSANGIYKHHMCKVNVACPLVQISRPSGLRFLFQTCQCVSRCVIRHVRHQSEQHCAAFVVEDRYGYNINIDRSPLENRLSHEPINLVAHY